MNVNLKHKIFFYTTTNSYYILLIIILSLLITNIILQFQDNFTIGIFTFLISFILFIIMGYVDTYIDRNFRPMKTNVNSMIRTFNINYLNSDIKLDVYHRYMLRDLKRLFKPVYIIKNEDEYTMEFENGPVYCLNSSSSGFTYYMTTNLRYSTLAFIRKYGLTNNDNSSLDDVEKLFEYYVNKFMI